VNEKTYKEAKAQRRYKEEMKRTEKIKDKIQQDRQTE